MFAAGPFSLSSLSIQNRDGLTPGAPTVLGLDTKPRSGLAAWMTWAMPCSQGPSHHHSPLACPLDQPSLAPPQNSTLRCHSTTWLLSHHLSKTYHLHPCPYDIPSMLYWWSQLSVSTRVLKTFLLLSIYTKMLNIISFRKLSWICFLTKRDPNRQRFKAGGKGNQESQELSIFFHLLILNRRKWCLER